MRKVPIGAKGRRRHSTHSVISNESSTDQPLMENKQTPRSILRQNLLVRRKSVSFNDPVAEIIKFVRDEESDCVEQEEKENQLQCTPAGADHTNDNSLATTQHRNTGNMTDEVNFFYSRYIEKP